MALSVGKFQQKKRQQQKKDIKNDYFSMYAQAVNCSSRDDIR